MLQTIDQCVQTVISYNKYIIVPWNIFLIGWLDGANASL